MPLKKNYLKSKPVCKVTFRLSKEIANGASNVSIVGDFNEWNKESLPMKSLKNGDFTATLDLNVNREYQFRYLIDHTNWENESDADKYVPSGVGNSDNSVVVI